MARALTAEMIEERLRQHQQQYGKWPSQTDIGDHDVVIITQEEYESLRKRARHGRT